MSLTPAQVEAAGELRIQGLKVAGVAVVVPCLPVVISGGRGGEEMEMDLLGVE